MSRHFASPEDAREYLRLMGEERIELAARGTDKLRELYAAQLRAHGLTVRPGGPASGSELTEAILEFRYPFANEAEVVNAGAVPLPKRSFLPKIPDEGSPEWELWVAAIDVAIQPALTHGATTTHALVPWTYIEALREALEKAAVDWRTAKKTDDAQRRAAREQKR